MTDPEREYLLHRIGELERASRRWKWLALAGTPILALLLLLAVANGIGSYLLYRDAVVREQRAREEVEQELTRSLDRLKMDRQALDQAEAEELARLAEELARDQAGPGAAKGQGQEP